MRASIYVSSPFSTMEKKKIKDKIEELQRNYVGELNTHAMNAHISNDKNTFLEELKVNHLDYLLYPTRDLTKFEWQCKIELENILLKFDLYLHEFDKNHPFVLQKDEQLRKTMGAVFSSEYLTDEEKERENYYGNKISRSRERCSNSSQRSRW